MKIVLPFISTFLMILAMYDSYWCKDHLLAIEDLLFSLNFILIWKFLGDYGVD
jgi:hypothetical protein